MVIPAVGVVVVVPFPFSDLSRSKLRPAVVLADADRDDWILCQVTSNPYGDPSAITLTDSSFRSGSLQTVSYVRPAKLFTANSDLIVDHVGVLKDDATNAIIDAVIRLLHSNRRNQPSPGGVT